MNTTKLCALLDTTGLPSKHTVALLQSEAKALLDRLDKLEAVAEAADGLATAVSRVSIMGHVEDVDRVTRVLEMYRNAGKGNK